MSGGTRLGRWLLAGLLGALVCAAAPAAAEPSDPVQRLEAALAEHPDDPDLLWALARELRAAGRSGEAAEAFARFEARFPGRRPDAAFERGRALYEAGRYAEALAALERALARDGSDAAAQLYRGLALRRLGRREAADRALRAAASLDPDVAPEALLLRGLGRLESGDRRTGEELLREAIELDPGGEVADRARRLLRGRPRQAPGRSLELYAEGGFEYDSNVTLDSGTDLPGPSTDRRDARWLWAGGVSWRPIRRDDASLTLGYRFDQTEHDELDGFDQQSHLVFGSGAWRAAERIALRLDAFGSTSHLDSDPYLMRAGLRPNLLVELGPRAGLLRAFVEGERRDYREKAFLPSLERDAFVVGAGFEHFLTLPWRAGSWSALGLRYARTDTEAKRDLFGLAAAFDHDLWEASWRLRVPLPWKVEASTTLTLGYERYAHHNVIDFLTDNGVGTVDPDKRSDFVVDARLALARPLTRWSDLELSFRRIERHSNVDLYAYDRDVLGVNLRLHTY